MFHMKIHIEKIYCILHLLLLDMYHYVDGCEKGIELNCENERGRLCGDDGTREQICTNCTFDECERHAKNAKSFAFSYSDHIYSYLNFKKGVCFTCDKISFLNRKNSLNSFGTYREPKEGKNLFIFKISIL